MTREAGSRDLPHAACRIGCRAVIRQRRSVMGQQSVQWEASLTCTRGMLVQTLRQARKPFAKFAVLAPPQTGSSASAVDFSFRCRRRQTRGNVAWGSLQGCSVCMQEHSKGLSDAAGWRSGIVFRMDGRLRAHAISSKCNAFCCTTGAPGAADRGIQRGGDQTMGDVPREQRRLRRRAPGTAGHCAGAKSRGF